MSKPYAFYLEGEIRFGPPFYRLKIHGKDVPNAIFGESQAELQGRRYLAVEEWLTTDYQQGPITRVAIFDFETELVAYLKTVEKGFVQYFKLDNGIFIYRKHYKGKGSIVEVEIEWDSIKNWVPYHS